jgi:prepilin-type N-terminal cleavage/methylation domain-containing protein
MRATGPSGWGKEADVNPVRRCRAGFTLTEILMATGILGIGLTMVASVFPVAVDQSRRSQDITMAALSARSVAAAIRANRQGSIDRALLPWLRKRGRGGYAVGDLNRANWPPWEITRNQWAKIPGTMRGYNPNFFLYYSGEVSFGTVTPSPGDSGMLPPRHDVTRTYVNFERAGGSISKGLDSVGVVWMAGGYVPVVFATPLDGYISAQSPQPIIGGPWLLTIVIYKSQGMPPPSVDYMACTQKKPDNTSNKPDRYMKSWVCREDDGGWPFRGAPGMYVMNWPGDLTIPRPVSLEEQNPSRIPTVVYLDQYHGEAYLIESVTPDPSGDAALDKMTFAATGLVNMPATYNRYPNTLTPPIVVKCITLPGAIAVYHTVIGD